MSVIALVHNAVGMYCGTLALGLGTSLNFPALMSLSVSRAPDTERGSVVGTFTAFFDLSQGAGTIALGAAAALANYRGAFATAAASAALGVIVLGVGERRRAGARMAECTSGATST